MKTKNILRAFRYIWPRARLWFILTVFFTIFLGLSPIISLWVMKDLINTVASLIQNDAPLFKLAFVLLSLLFIVTILSSIVKSVQDYIDSKIQIRLEHDLKKEISLKTSNVPLAYFDIPEFYNHMERVSGSPGQSFLAPVKNVMNIGQAVISGLSFLAFLFSIHWSLVLLGVLGAIPILIVQSHYGNKRFWLRYIQSPTKREANYIERLLNNRQTAQEIRLFNLPSYFLERWSNKFIQNASESLNLLKRQKYAEVGLDGFTGLLYAGAAGIIIWLIKHSTVKIGEFVAIFQAVEGTQSATNQISSSFAQMYEDCLYVNDYFRFIDFEEPLLLEPEALHAFPDPLTKGIRFDNVSFHYFQGDKEVLKGINLEIQKGEKIAIVGHNGSGKTTLIKCLLGLYTPTKGNIYFDDVNCKNVNKQDLRDHIAIIFQDFIKYAFSVRENIAFGNIKELDNEHKVMKVARESGVEQFVNQFKNKYDTYLGRFLRNGEDLSGGQWQKIALSRALFKDSEIIVLDEPTSSLDPQSEIEVLNQFKKMSKNKMAIFISHRMSAARLADRIIVMKDGRIVETGSHEQLIKCSGEYARMYDMQACWFNEITETEKEVAAWRN